MEAESVGMPGWRPASRGGESSVAVLAPRGQLFPSLAVAARGIVELLFLGD